ncbi:transcription factor TFIIIC subunit tfc4 [Mortierella antarctica]|nr:transcription factor TFIIIC subunit tfc4 [Mortierella antarctica]
MDSHEEQGSYNSSPSNSAPGTPTTHSNEILSNLQRSMFEQHGGALSSGPGNPLLERLNQNRNELAELEAVSHQLGPDGTMPPAVIGDYVGHLPNRNNNHNNNSTLQNSGFDELDEYEEEVNELDEGDFEGDDDDVTLNFNQTIDQTDDLPGMTAAKRAEAKEAASAVDPQSLIDAGGVGGSANWDTLGAFDSSVPDDDELDGADPALEELGLALAPKSKKDRKKGSKKGAVVYHPEVQRLLGLANGAYVNKEYKEAVELFQQVIIKDPRVFQAWNTMGVIQEELGNTEKALQLYLVAAHITPKDGDLWKKLAQISKDCGYNQQALYCFTKAYAADKTDLDSLWDRSIMQAIMEQYDRAIRGFLSLLTFRPHYMAALEELVKLYSTYQSQDPKKYRENMHRAMELYEKAYLHYSSLPDQDANATEDPFAPSSQVDARAEPFGYSAVNMLSELYIMFEEYQKALQMIKTWSRRLQRRSHQIWWNDYQDDREFETDPEDEEFQSTLGENRTRGLPVDLRVKLGICRLMMEEVKEAKAQFKYLWRCSVEDFPDLYEEIAELYVTKQMWKDGYNVIRAILQFDEMDIPKIWIMAGECLRHMHQLKEAKDYLEQAHRADASNVDVSMMLAEVYEELGNLPQALTLVNYIRQVNAERLAEQDKKRREAKIARDAKAGKDTSHATAQLRALAPAIPPSMDGTDYTEDGRMRPLLPRTPAQNQVQLSIRSFTMPADPAAERDRQAETRAAKKEQERLERAKAEELSAAEQQEFILKFNRLETIYQRIDTIEKSRVWAHRKDAVIATRTERTQYIQAAREVITVFLSNKSFFVKDRWKPYMGGEARSWSYRKDQADPENSGLSEHVVDMAERLSSAMGLNKSTSEPEPKPVEPEKPVLRPPTTYREISFDTWYIVMIRQAIYLTFEDRFPEALELLMEIHRANVFFVVPRRRSGIMMVTLACAMWVGDYDTVGNASRYLCSFGGVRPFVLRLYQSVFTLGPRGHHKYFAWAQTTTLKYIKRFSDMMRAAVGTHAAPIARKKTTSKRRAVQGKRVKRTFHSFARLDSPRAEKSKNKRQKVETAGTAKNIDVPWTKSVFQRHFVPKTAQDKEDQATETSTPAASSIVAQEQTTAPIPSEEPIPSSEPDLVRGPSTSNDDAQPASSSAPQNSSQPQSSFQLHSSFKPHGSSQPQSSSGTSPAPHGKRKIVEEEDELKVEDDENEEADEDQGEEEDDEEEEEEDEGRVSRAARRGNYVDMTEAEGFEDDDDYDLHDEAYKTEDDDVDLDREEAGYEYGDWEDEDEEEFSGPSKHKYFKTTNRRFDTIDEDPDLDDPTVTPKKKKVKKAKAGDSSPFSAQKAITPQEGEEEGEGKRRSRRSFTTPVFTSFSISLIMFHGYLLAASRSHIGAAAQFADCLHYAPQSPMIQLYLANQLFNIAVQRTVYNRQVTLMRGMAMLQSYYHGRRIGRGTLAFAERERKTRRLASSKDKVAGKEGEAASTADNTATSAAATTTTTTTATAPPPSTAAENAEAEEPPLRQCMQEAEYNFARGFHQMGMNQQAMLHYRRVLELPSWKEVEMQQALETKRRRRALREARRMESAEARDARIQMQLKRREEIREWKAKKKEEAKEARAKGGEEGVSQVGGEVQTEEVEEEEEDDEKFDFEEDDLDDESTDEDEEEDDDENKLSKPTDGRIRLQDDSTDLKREAAFNLAKIYMQSGAVGQARLLIHKYCTM